MSEGGIYRNKPIFYIVYARACLFSKVFSEMVWRDKLGYKDLTVDQRISLKGDISILSVDLH